MYQTYGKFCYTLLIQAYCRRMETTEYTLFIRNYFLRRKYKPPKRKLKLLNSIYLLFWINGVLRKNLFINSLFMNKGKYFFYKKEWNYHNNISVNLTFQANLGGHIKITWANKHFCQVCCATNEIETWYSIISMHFFRWAPLL